MAINIFSVIASPLPLFVVAALMAGAQMVSASEPDYAGRSPDASWREAAQKRIERHRKGELEIRVVDADGNPVPDANVTVAMRRSDFKFGTALQANQFALARAAGGETRRNAQRYLAEIERLFNSVVFENDLKPRKGFGWLDGSVRSRVERYALPWLIQRGFEIRGHYLVGSPLVHDERSPALWLAAADNPAPLERLLTGYTVATARHFVDIVDQWDVMNHSLRIETLDDEAIGRIVTAADAAAADTPMFFNENKILASPGLGDPWDKREAYWHQIRRLLDAGVPVGGIGMQAHFLSDQSRLTSIPDVIRTLDRFAELGLPIRITEHDVDSPDAELQRDYSRDFLIAVFSHPAVEGVTYWGFCDYAFWSDSAQFFDSEWNLKPAGEAIIDLIHRQWRTDVALDSNDHGVAYARVFLGEYDISVTRPGLSLAESFEAARGAPPAFEVVTVESSSTPTVMTITLR